MYIDHQEECAETGIILKIIADSDPFNPRTENDNASIMVCDHGRYSLGDTDGHAKALEAIRASVDYCEDWEEEVDMSHGPDLFELIKSCSDIIVLPLFLYDHSGITIRNTPFSCRWDSGQVGFQFMTDKKIAEEGMDRVSANKLMYAETKEYDMYLTGDVWGFVIETNDGEHLESCWGYFGRDYIEEEARSYFKACIEDARQEAARELEASRPDMYAD